ncbi:hypothetical protein GPALN_002152 [Globodera pallida]|nr:hypothetical protein GPALN_002152 [Globodera pallida]
MTVFANSFLPIAFICLLGLGTVPNSTILAAAAWTDWKSGKDLGDGGAGDLPLTINPEGEIVISAKSMHGVVPDVIKLYFNGGTNDESRKMILNICVPNVAGSREKCKDGLILCFVGQMDPANAPVITQFQLKNYFENNEIATKCENAQANANWTEFEGKKLHGFQIAHVEDKLLLSSSTSLETVTCTVEDDLCCAIQLGEPGILGGFVAGHPLNRSETFVDKAWRGGLLRQENPVSALAFDLLGYIPQGGGLGIIADKCDMQITLVDCVKMGQIFPLLSVLLFVSFIASSFGLRQQSVGVTGRLFCGDKPSSNVLVKLFDKDTGLDPDDQLDSTRTDAMGNFKVQGDERETTNIDPELKIYHHCNKGLNPCPRKWIITIPDKYIHSGRAPPKKYFDLGNVNLEVEVEGETFDCIH